MLSETCCQSLRRQADAKLMPSWCQADAKLQRQRREKALGPGGKTSVVVENYHEIPTKSPVLLFENCSGDGNAVWILPQVEPPNKTLVSVFNMTSSTRKHDVGWPSQELLGGLSHLIPSGKRLHNYGKSQFLIGKSTINGHFHSIIGL